MGTWINNELAAQNSQHEFHVFKKFKEEARPITYNTFSRTLGCELVDQVRKKLDYAKDKRSGLTLNLDPETKFYRGTYNHKRALVVEKQNHRMIFTYEAGYFG